MIFIIELLFFLISNAVCAEYPNSVLFYYSSRPLTNEQLNRFDWIILDSNANCVLKEIREQFWMKKKPKLIGYLSIGEVEKSEKSFFKDCILGKNKEWNSYIIDLRKDICFNKLLKKAKIIHNKAFDGFFLDTIDSYQVVLTKNEWKEYERAEVKFIKTLRKKYPDSLILVNRAFNIFDNIKSYIDGFVVEELFYNIDSEGNIEKNSKDEVNYLINKLSYIKRNGIPVIVIDYIPPYRIDLIWRDLINIRKLGFIPYISNRNLCIIGYSCGIEIPRKIILIYDSTFTFSKIRQVSAANRLLQLPVEYLGFKPEIYDINREKLPPPYKSEGYLGVIVTQVSKKNLSKLDSWLIKAKRNGLKIFFFNNLPLKKNYLKSLD
ncbi:MAG: hypothetical protein DSZ26_03130 [Thermovibrio sp.]|nr:MAG: hypothetical protein DSZ26_03130 [Thermovibrio sp.]